METQLTELGKITHSIAAIVQACADSSSADDLLALFKTLDDWYSTSLIKEGCNAISESFRKFRSAVNIGEKAKSEFDDYRQGRLVMRC